MKQGGQGVRWWVMGSAGLMIVGAFGPWVSVLGRSVSGTDGSNDGWFVVAAAALGGLLYQATRQSRGAAVWPLLGGIGGVAVTLYDRSNVQHAIDNGGALARALAQVGWGLNLALAASASMVVASLVSLWAHRSDDAPLPAPRTPPPSPPPAFPPPGSTAPSAEPPTASSPATAPPAAAE